MFKGQTISDKKFYETSVKIFFLRAEARLIRRAVEPWEGYLEDNFRRGTRIKDGVTVKFLGWELCELVYAVETEAKLADDQAYAQSLKLILKQKILPVKKAWAVA
ncbi:MAG: hypothetical protein HQL22_11540 [Candidatus Omnitrophica bacterium]|nr:hypothetical protein [Candidatus Omnitrophota bacterium]